MKIFIVILSWIKVFINTFIIITTGTINIVNIAVVTYINKLLQVFVNFGRKDTKAGVCVYRKTQVLMYMESFLWVAFFLVWLVLDLHNAWKVLLWYWDI